MATTRHGIPDLGAALAQDMNRAHHNALVAGLIQPHTAQQAAADLSAALAAEELAEAQAELERLQADLTSAKIMAPSAAAMLAAAEDQWKRATKHSKADADRLERLREEAPAAEQTVADLERRIAETEQRIARLRGAEEQRRRREMVTTLYTPVVQRLMPIVRDLLAALSEQHTVYMRLLESGAGSYITLDELSAPDGRTGEDDLPRILAEWLAKAERSEYRA